MKIQKSKIFWIVVITYLLVILGVVAYFEGDRAINSYQIMMDDTSAHFVTREDIQILFEEEYNITELSLDKVEIAELEKNIEDIPGVADAEVYTKLNGTLMTELKKETPILRVINTSGESYYITDSGELIPYDENYIPRVVVANGKIARNYSQNITLNQKNNSNKHQLLKELYKIARYIHNNEFWSAQIEQLYVNTKQDIELLPRVGAHIIIFGRERDMRWKFRKLYALYHKGFDKKDWNNYDTISLKYKNQVVCSKR